MDYQETLRRAMAEAAIEVDSWVPEKYGDKVAGQVIAVGSISTTFGTYWTTNIDVTEEDAVIQNGKKTKVGVYRIAWMGAVLQATYERLKPSRGDIVALHYQKDIEPKTPGFQSYPLIMAVVFNANGEPKEPINLNVTVPTEEQMSEADPRTGELPPFPDDNDTVA